MAGLANTTLGRCDLRPRGSISIAAVLPQVSEAKPEPARELVIY